jgi:hypothetical protein
VVSDVSDRYHGHLKRVGSTSFSWKASQGQGKVWHYGM